MKAAAADTALSALTKGGLFSIATDAKSTENKLRLEISHIGPAETAKLSIYVGLKDQASNISTASVAVHDLDYQGISTENKTGNPFAISCTRHIALI